MSRVKLKKRKNNVCGTFIQLRLRYFSDLERAHRTVSLVAAAFKAAPFMQVLSRVRHILLRRLRRKDHLLNLVSGVAITIHRQIYRARERLSIPDIN